MIRIINSTSVRGKLIAINVKITGRSCFTHCMPYSVHCNGKEPVRPEVQPCRQGPRIQGPQSTHLLYFRVLEVNQKPGRNSEVDVNEGTTLLSAP